MWVDLHGFRPRGFGPGPVPLCEIVAYLDLHEIFDPEERRELVVIVTGVDREYLAKQAAKKSKEPEEPDGNSPDGSGRSSRKNRS